MNRDVFVPLLKSVILLNIVKIISSDNYSSLHLLALHDTSQNATTDTYITSKGALLINVSAFYSLQNSTPYFSKIM